MRKRIAALVFGFLLAASAQAETIRNPVIGLSIEKPDEWHVLTADANAKNLEKVDFGSPEFQAAIRRYASVPLIAFTRYLEPYPDLNASVKLNTRPVGSFVGKSGQEILQAVLPSLQAVMSEVKIITAPETTRLAGKPAGHMALSYTLKSGSASYPAIAEMWVVPRGAYFILIGAGYRPDEKTGDRKTVSNIISLIKLDN